MDIVEVDAVRDQRAQQAQVGQHRGQHRQAALVAGVGRRRRVRIGAGVEQRQRALDPAVARGVVQRGVEILTGCAEVVTRTGPMTRVSAWPRNAT